MSRLTKTGLVLMVVGFGLLILALALGDRVALTGLTFLFVGSVLSYKAWCS